MSGGLRRGVVIVSAGAVIGVVEVVLAISFAVLVFSGFLEDARPAGIGIYLVAAALTLAILAWRAGTRGVVGSVQDAAVPVLAIVASSAALHTFGGVDQAFLTVVAATMIVTLLTALTFLVLGTFRLGNLARFIPYPVDRRLPRRHRVAADEGGPRGRGEHRSAAGNDRPVRRSFRVGALASGLRLRRPPADRDPGRETGRS